MEEWFKKNIKGDPVIWMIVIVFYGLSTWVVYSAVSGIALRYKDGDAESFLYKHVLYICISLTAMWFVSRINYVYFRKLAQPLLFFSWILLTVVLFAGVTINGSTAWLKVGPITFQPSDLGKWAMILTVASMLAKRQRVINDHNKALIPIIARIGITCGLIAIADVGSAATLFITCFVILFIGRIPVKQLFALTGVGIIALVLALLVGQRMGTVIHRISDWWGMITEGESHDLAYQVEQGYIAISRGRFWGVGLGHSQQRYFLPEAFSDYIYAIIIEEHGLKMGIVVIVLYLALLYRAMKVTSKSDKAFGGLLSIGLAFSLVIQAMINMMVVVGLGPVTGIPLPFLSMGGTALLFSGISMGVLLSISRKDLHEPEIKNFNAPRSDQKEE